MLNLFYMYSITGELILHPLHSETWNIEKDAYNPLMHLLSLFFCPYFCAKLCIVLIWEKNWPLYDGIT